MSEHWTAHSERAIARLRDADAKLTAEIHLAPHVATAELRALFALQDRREKRRRRRHLAVSIALLAIAFGLGYLFFR